MRFHLAKLAEKVSDGLFTVVSIIVHTLFFVLWIGTHGFGFDNNGFTIGTAILSLEAIYITLLVGVVVKRSSERERATEDEADDRQEKLAHEHERLLYALTKLVRRVERTAELIYSHGEHE